MRPELELERRAVDAASPASASFIDRLWFPTEGAIRKRMLTLACVFSKAQSSRSNVCRPNVTHAWAPSSERVRNLHQRGFGSPTRQWDEPCAHSGRLPSSGSKRISEETRLDVSARTLSHARGATTIRSPPVAPVKALFGRLDFLEARAFFTPEHWRPNGACRLLQSHQPTSTD